MDKVFICQKDGETTKEITKESKKFMVSFQCSYKVHAIQMWSHFCVTENSSTTFGKPGDYLIFKSRYFLNHPNEGFDVVSKKTFEKEYERVA